MMTVSYKLILKKKLLYVLNLLVSKHKGIGLMFMSFAMNSHAISSLLQLKHKSLISSPLKDTVIKSNRIRCKAYNQQGFNLVELIVTLAILAIIITIAAPSIFSYLASMEAKRIRYDLINTLTLAKAESYIKRQNLLFCLSDTGGRCNKNSNETLLLFVDNNDNKNFEAGTDDLISELRLNPKYGTLHLRAGRRHYIKFYGDTGQPRGHFGHIKYCPSSTYSQAMYQVSFSQVGIIKYKPNNIHDTGCGD